MSTIVDIVGKFLMLHNIRYLKIKNVYYCRCQPSEIFIKIYKYLKIKNVYYCRSLANIFSTHFTQYLKIKNVYYCRFLFFKKRTIIKSI